MEEYSFEKGSKFKEKDRFLNVNQLFLPGYRWALKKLYHTSLRPEVIVLLSLLAGLISALFYARGSYAYSLLGAAFIVMKNYLDSMDGHLARAKGLESRFGRFLDSLSDALVYFFLFTAIAFNLNDDSSFLLAYAAMLSAFLQCSFYNYYVLSYQTFLYGEGLNRTDERLRGEERAIHEKSVKGKALLFLQGVYQWIYGWQDSVIRSIDRATLKIYRLRVGETCDTFTVPSWYADKGFLALTSPLCFGTQIFLLAIFTVTDNLEGYLVFLLTGANLYTLSLILFRALLK